MRNYVIEYGGMLISVSLRSIKSMLRYGWIRQQKQKTEFDYDNYNHDSIFLLFFCLLLFISCLFMFLGIFCCLIFCCCCPVVVAVVAVVAAVDVDYRFVCSWRMGQEQFAVGCF